MNLYADSRIKYHWYLAAEVLECPSKPSSEIDQAILVLSNIHVLCGDESIRQGSKGIHAAVLEHVRSHNCTHVLFWGHHQKGSKNPSLWSYGYRQAGSTPNVVESSCRQTCCLAGVSCNEMSTYAVTNLTEFVEFTCVNCLCGQVAYTRLKRRR